MSEYDDLLYLFENPSMLKSLSEHLTLINRLFRELERARIGLCFSICINEDETRIYARAVRYTSILNILYKLYGKKEKTVIDVLNDMYIKCKEIYDVLYVDGKYRMLPKRSKIYRNIRRRLEQFGDDYGD